MIYKNDLGEPVLRATRLGGITLFTDQRPGGAAAALAGPARPLRLAIMGPQALCERLPQASARASRAARRLIPFEAEATPDLGGADRRRRRGDQRGGGADGQARGRPQAPRPHLTGPPRRGPQGLRRPAQRLLEVTVAPPQGLAGRPSSDRIVHVGARLAG